MEAHEKIEDIAIHRTDSRSSCAAYEALVVAQAPRGVKGPGAMLSRVETRTVEVVATFPYDSAVTMSGTFDQKVVRLNRSSRGGRFQRHGRVERASHFHLLCVRGANRPQLCSPGTRASI